MTFTVFHDGFVTYGQWSSAVLPEDLPHHRRIPQQAHPIGPTVGPSLSEWREEAVRQITRRIRRLVCGPGALARLSSGQAYLIQEGEPPPHSGGWIAEEAPNDA